MMKILPKIEYALAGLVLLVVMLSGLQSIKAHEDEAQWIAMSDSFEAFITGDFSSPIFSDHHWALVQPHLTRYIIGFWRLMGGYHVEDLHLNPLFHSTQGEYNLQIPEPDPGLYYWARLPMALLACLAGLCLFFLARRTGGRISGYVLLALYLSNAFLMISLRRAMGESALLLSALIAVILGAKAIESWVKEVSHLSVSFTSLKRPFLWFTAIGIVAGISASIKLNGAVIGLAGILLPLIVVIFFPGSVSGSLKRLFLVRVSLAVIFSSLFIFILLNPYLYANPFHRIGRMLHYKIEEMQWQQVIFPASVIQGTPVDRAILISKRVLQDYNSLQFPGAWIINSTLTITGLAIFGLAARRWARQPDSKGAAAISLLVTGLIVTLPSLATPLDWDRYYLFPVIFSLVCIAAAAGHLFNLGTLKRTTPRVISVK